MGVGSYLGIDVVKIMWFLFLVVISVGSEGFVFCLGWVAWKDGIMLCCIG